MTSRYVRTLFLVIFFFPPTSFAASGLELIVSSSSPVQGSPIMISLAGTTTLSGIEEASFDKEPLSLFLYKEKPTALYGIDLAKKSGIHTLSLRLKNKDTLTKDIAVLAIKKEQAVLGIPVKLGGNTEKSAKKLVDTLAEENNILANLRVQKKVLWSTPFIYPVHDPVVTDTYGYVRKTGSYSIAHKGTDYRASVGTPVFAMNRGVVRLVKTFRNYGKTIVIDHGNGVMTFYMHLSSTEVKEGTLIEQGALIGKSGKTGYAESPHLHLTVRINNVSIDPEQFITLFTGE